VTYKGQKISIYSIQTYSEKIFAKLETHIEHREDASELETVVAARLFVCLTK